MIEFEVKDMTCGHCVSTITKALNSVDSRARFAIDQARHLVRIESTDADPKELHDAIADAGYTPVRVAEVTWGSSSKAHTPSSSSGADLNQARAPAGPTRA